MRAGILCPKCGMKANQPIIKRLRIQDEVQLTICSNINFHTGVDYHKEVASIVFNVPVEQVTPEQRTIAKTMSFISNYQ